MRTDFGKKTFLYPMPVLIIGTYNEDGTPNAMNAAWGGIFNDNQICICVASSHKTTINLKARKAFTVSMADAKNVAACDYVGLVSGKEVPDKIKKSGLTAVKSSKVDAPYFEELKMTLECEMVSYDDKTEQLIGNIINISADDSVITDGKIDVEKLQPVTYDSVNHKYRVIGKAVADAFAVGKSIK